MRKRSIPVIIVAGVLILVGGMGFVYHLKDVNDTGISIYESIWVLVLRLVAIMCGILLLYRINWSRWLAMTWLAYHVVIGAYNSTEQMITHIVFFLLVTALLYLPVSSAYFKNKKHSKHVDL